MDSAQTVVRLGGDRGLPRVQRPPAAFVARLRAAFSAGRRHPHRLFRSSIPLHRGSSGSLRTASNRARWSGPVKPGVMASYSLWATCNRRSRGTPPLPWFVTFETSQKPYATTCAPLRSATRPRKSEVPEKMGLIGVSVGVRHAMLLGRDCVGSCLRPREDRTNRRGGCRPCLRPINPPRPVAPGCASPLDRSRRIVQRFCSPVRRQRSPRVIPRVHRYR